MTNLVQRTAFVVDLINLGVTSESNIALLNPLESGMWWIDTDGQLHEMEAVTSLSQQVEFQGMEHCSTLYVAGALVDSFLEKVRKNKQLRHVELVVRDFTKIFVSPQQFRLFEKMGGCIKVLQRSKLIAVTVNPTSPTGYMLDSAMLCDKISQAINLPVYDLLKDRVS